MRLQPEAFGGRDYEQQWKNLQVGFAALTGVYKTIRAAYTAGDGDRLLANTTLGAFAITMPSAKTSLGSVSVRNIGTNNLTVLPVSGQLINGAASITLAANAFTRLVPGDDGNWWGV